VRNFQILIVSVVKTYQQHMQIASASGDFVAQTHRRQSIDVHGGWTPRLAAWCPPICGHPRICLYCLKCTKFGQLIPMKI